MTSNLLVANQIIVEKNPQLVKLYKEKMA
jgi:vacuolar protein-sorting-associated protein 4